MEQKQGGQSNAAHFEDPGDTIEPGDGAAVATGLDNPRGMDLWRGTLFIAEAGTGGNGSCVPGIFAPEICLGRSGAVTAVTHSGRQRRIFEGLPSLAGPDGTFAYGPSDVSIKDGLVYVSVGGPNEVEYRELVTRPSPESSARSNCCSVEGASPSAAWPSSSPATPGNEADAGAGPSGAGPRDDGMR